MSFMGESRTSSTFMSGNFLARAARIAASADFWLAALAGAAVSAAATEVAINVASEALASRHNNSFFMGTLVTLARFDAARAAQFNDSAGGRRGESTS